MATVGITSWTAFLVSSSLAAFFHSGLRRVSGLILRLYASNGTTRVLTLRVKEIWQVLTLPSCASNRSAWLSHAPGIEQFGKPLFW